MEIHKRVKLSPLENARTMPHAMGSHVNEWKRKQIATFNNETIVVCGYGSYS